MFNLLPDILKNEIKTEYRFRWFIVIAFFVLCLELSFIILLFPSWLISMHKENDLSQQVNFIDNSTSSKNTNAELQNINEINQRLNIINTTFEYPEVVPIFKNIISYKTKDISLLKFDYTSMGTSTADISVQGVSATRESLILFVKNLQKSESFSSVFSPVSNLEKDKNIEFVVNLHKTK